MWLSQDFFLKKINKLLSFVSVKNIQLRFKFATQLLSYSVTQLLKIMKKINQSFIGYFQVVF